MNWRVNFYLLKAGNISSGAASGFCCPIKNDCSIIFNKALETAASRDRLYFHTKAVNEEIRMS